MRNVGGWATAVATGTILTMLPACGRTSADPVELTYDNQASLWHLTLDRHQTRNVRDAVGIGTTLSVLCSAKAPPQLCNVITATTGVSAIYLATVYEDGNCIGLDLALQPVPSVLPWEVPHDTFNCF